MSDVVRATGPEDLPVAVVGAGPVGLAAAAHLLRRGLEPVVLEQGPAVGASVRAWGHVPMLSSWRFHLDRASAALLGEHGWWAAERAPLPTGSDVAQRSLDAPAPPPAIPARLRPRPQS